jgi:membrane protease YdiL (CAAX protease family)
MPRDRMLRPGFAVGLWAAFCLVAAFYGNWSGFGARPFAATLGAFAILLAGEICLASPGIREPLVRATGPQGGAMLALWPLGAYTLYAAGTGSLSWSRIGIAAIYMLAPLALAASAHAAKPGVWQDYAIMLAVALPVRLGWLHRLFPYPEFRLGYILPMLLGINVGLAAFLFVRRLDGIGYSIGWRLDWGIAVALCFAAVAVIDIPLGIAIHFVRFDPGAAHWRALPIDLLSIFVFTGWPEEFLFRGLLQNLLSKSLRNENSGWIAASIIFGLSHIDHGVFPNWRYVLLATIAGVFYGLAWQRSKSMFPAAVVHTLVDTTWHLLFRTL